LRIGGTAITPPFRRPSTAPRVPNRAISVLTISLEGDEYQLKKTEGQIYLMEIIKFLRLYSTIHKQPPFEVLSGTETHR
jgi:hypothetical protein